MGFSWCVWEVSDGGKKQGATGPDRPCSLSLWQERDGGQGGAACGSLPLRLARHHPGCQHWSPQGEHFSPLDLAQRSHKQEQQMIPHRGAVWRHLQVPVLCQNPQANKTHQPDCERSRCRGQVWLKSPHSTCVISFQQGKARGVMVLLSSEVMSCAQEVHSKTAQGSSCPYGSPGLRSNTT